MCEAMSARMPPASFGSKNHAGRIARLKRCGPRPTVWITRPIAPSATSLAATSDAGVISRSEKQIEKMRPVSFTTRRTSSSASRAMTPGLSTSTSLPLRIASIAIAARSRGTAAHTIASIDGIAHQRIAILDRRNFGEALAEALEHARVGRLRPVARAGRARIEQALGEIVDVTVIETDRGEAHDGTLLVRRERIVREGCAASRQKRGKRPACSQSQRRFVASHNRELKRPGAVQ